MAQRISKEVIPILSVNFVGLLGYSIVLPLLVFLVTKMGGDAVMYGFIGAVYPVFQLIGSPILGKLSDNIGRKQVLLLSQAGTLLAWILFIVAYFLPAEVNIMGSAEYLITLPLLVLILARAVDGFTGGNISVANAYLSDVSTEENRTRNFSYMSASSSLGFVLGPALAGILAATVLEELLPVFLATGISLITMIMIMVWLPNKEQDDCQPIRHKSVVGRLFGGAHKECNAPVEDKPNNRFKDLLKIKGLGVMLIMYFLTFLAFSLFYSAFPIYSTQKLGWDPSQLGGFLAISSVVIFIVNIFGLPQLNKVLKNFQIVFLGALCLGGAFLLLELDNIAILYVANIILSVGNGLLWPSFMAILSGKGDHTNQGSIMGWGNSMGSLGSVLGLILGGILFKTLGTNVFMIGAVIFFVMGVITLLFLRTKNQAT
ncbi:MAG: MFS transporter [Flavobacteriales bacterium]|nr:MFS transporter [Flavobacteriales bacterium]